jgi:hypothetical protein
MRRPLTWPGLCSPAHSGYRVMTSFTRGRSRTGDGAATREQQLPCGVGWRCAIRIGAIWSMEQHYTVIGLSVSLLSCGEVTSNRDASLADAGADVQEEDGATQQPGCALPLCNGTADLPVGAAISGDDGCNWDCTEAGAPTCMQTTTCVSCESGAPFNICDGGQGMFGTGPNCPVPTCAGVVMLPFRAGMLGGDGCLYTCDQGGQASCASFHGMPCTCGQLVCDGGM